MEGGDHYIPLHRAILGKDVMSVGKLLRRDVDVNEIDHMKLSPLMLAIKTCQTTITLVLFDHDGLNIHQQDAIGKTAMHYALEHGDCTTMTHLLIRGADLNTTCSNGRTPLIVASTLGHLGLVRRIVRDPRLHIDQFDHLGATALWYACDEGHAAIVRILMSYSANVNATNSLIKTPLIIAAEKGHLMCVQALLTSKLVRVEHRDKFGYNALYYAFQRNNLEMVQELLQEGNACLRYQTPLEHKTLLMIASQHGNLDLVRLCLTHERNCPSVNEVDSGLRTALYYGCKYPEITKLLLHHSAIADYADISGKTPVMRAAEIGSTEVVEILVKCKVELNLIDYEGMTALAYACLFGRSDAARVLVQAGASPLISDMDDKTPLMLAAIHRHETLIELLLDMAVDVGLNYRDYLGYTALQYACTQNSAKTVATLLQRGASTDPNTGGVTPLMRSCQKKSLDCVRLLLPYSNIDAQDFEGETALVYACSEPENLACVQFLLDNHANPAVPSNQSFTALMEACRVNRSELIEVLLNAMTVSQINIQGRYGDTALTLACGKNNLNTICMLLNKGADPYKKCDGGMTAIMLAAANGNADIVEELARRTGRYHLDLVDDDHFTALYHASLRGHKEVVKVLVRQGADATIASDRETTPLVVASEQGSFGIVVDLVMSVRTPDRIRYINKGNDFLVTPLFQAACYGYLDIVEFLLQHGATQFTVDRHGDSPLTGASQRKKPGTVRRLLKSATLTEIDHVNSLGRSALYYAIATRNTSILDMLHQAGASTKPLFEWGAIWRAGYPDKIDTDLLRRLTDDFDTDVNAINRYGRTALYILATMRFPQKEKIVHFLDRGANPWVSPDGVLAVDRTSNHTIKSLLKNAMQEHERFKTLDLARTLYGMHEYMERASYATKTRNAKRLKCLEVAPEVLKSRMVVWGKLPTYTPNVSSHPLMQEIIEELMKCPNDDIFTELHDMMAVPWNIDEYLSV